MCYVEIFRWISMKVTNFHSKSSSISLKITNFRFFIYKSSIHFSNFHTFEKNLGAKIPNFANFLKICSKYTPSSVFLLQYRQYFIKSSICHNELTRLWQHFLRARHIVLYMFFDQRRSGASYVWKMGFHTNLKSPVLL